MKIIWHLTYFTLNYLVVSNEIYNFAPLFKKMVRDR